MTGLVSMDIAQLEAMLKDMGQPRFRAKQVFQWLSRGERPQNMTNLPKELRSKLSDIHFDGAEIYDKFVSKKRRYDKISVLAFGRQYCGRRAYALPLWKYHVHIHTSRL